MDKNSSLSERDKPSPVLENRDESLPSDSSLFHCYIDTIYIESI